MNAAGIVTKPARALVLASGLIAATSVVGLAQDVTVGLGTLPNLPLTSPYVNPPAGIVSLGGHSFDLTSGSLIRLFGGQSASISGSYPNAKATYLLINSFDTWTTQYAGQPIGRVVLTFSDGTTQTITLTAGSNVREWRPGTDTVNTATDPNLANVWNGQAQAAAGGGPAIIDMLTINAPTQYRTLTNITITVDRNDGTTGIGLLISAITTDDGPAPLPVCIRAGNSCSTPAAENSQSWKWQPVLPGTTNANANANASNGDSNGNGHGHGNANANGHNHKSE